MEPISLQSKPQQQSQEQRFEPPTRLTVQALWRIGARTEAWDALWRAMLAHLDGQRTDAISFAGHARGSTETTPGLDEPPAPAADPAGRRPPRAAREKHSDAG
jgi:hypothetical protein